MICGFCGSNFPRAPDSPSKNAELAPFVYSNCEHPDEPALTGFAQLRQLKQMVQNQLDSIQKLEDMFVEQRKKLLVQFQLFINTNMEQFQKDEKSLDAFNENFNSLKNIKVDDVYQGILKPNLQDYFNKNELTSWTAHCKEKLQRISKKFMNLEELIVGDMDKYYKTELYKISNSVIPDKSVIDLHNMSYLMLEKVEDRDKESNKGKITALKHFYSEMNANYTKYVNSVYTTIKKTIGRVEEKMESNKIMLTDLVSEFKKDFRIVDVFSDFGTTLTHCLIEMTRRSKYKLLCGKLLNLLNEITQNENMKRVDFLNKYSSKIPSQIFPNVKNLVKKINIEKILESIDDDLPNKTIVEGINKAFEKIETEILNI